MPTSKYEDSAWYRMAYSLDEGQWVQLPEGQSWEEHPPTRGDFCSRRFMAAASPPPDADDEAFQIELAALFELAPAALFGFAPPPPLGRRAAAAAPAATSSSTPPPAGPPLARAEVKAPPEGLSPPRPDAQATMKAPPARRLREPRGWDLPPPPPPGPPPPPPPPLGTVNVIWLVGRRVFCMRHP